jgi:hypothetical protein
MTTTTTAKVYTVVDFAGRTLKTVARKDTAIKYAVAQDAEFVLSPAGKVVWTTPNTVSPSLSVEPVVLAETGPVTVTVEDVTPAAPATGKRVYKRAKRAPKIVIGELGGRFELEVYGGHGETGYAKKATSTLRHQIGCTWAELNELGLNSEKAARAFAQQASGKDWDTLYADLEAIREEAAANA